MSLSYTVGSNARTRTSGRKRRQNLPNVNSPGKLTSASTPLNPPPNRGGSKPFTTSTVNRGKPSSKANLSSSKTKSLSQQKPFGQGARIVTLADLSLDDNKSTEQKTKPPTLAKRSPGVSLHQSTVNTKHSAASSNTKYSHTASTLNRTKRSNNLNSTKPVNSGNSSSRNMSYSSGSNSSTQRQQGYSSSTGRPVGRPAHRDMPPESTPGAGRDEQQQQPRPGEAVYNPDGCHTKIAPNQAKRNKMQSIASREEQNYKRYKEQKRVPHVSITPSRVGGARLNQDEVRRRQEREQRQKRDARLVRKQELDRQRAEERERESAAIKAKGRAQAERNKQKAEEEQRKRERELDSDRKRANEAFLRRLEQQQQ